MTDAGGDPAAVWAQLVMGWQVAERLRQFSSGGWMANGDTASMIERAVVEVTGRAPTLSMDRGQLNVDVALPTARAFDPLMVGEGRVR